MAATPKHRIVVNYMALTVFATQIASLVEDIAVKHVFTMTDQALVIGTIVGGVAMAVSLLGGDVQGEPAGQPIAVEAVQVTQAQAQGQQAPQWPQ